MSNLKATPIHQEFAGYIEKAFPGLTLETIPRMQAIELELAFIGGALIGQKKAEEMLAAAHGGGEPGQRAFMTADQLLRAFTEGSKFVLDDLQITANRVNLNRPT